MEPVFIPAWPDAARALGVGKTKLFELLKDGDLESCQIGRRRLVAVESIHAFADRLRKQTVKAPAA